ncbi:PAS domain S-box protein [delta proteobacterium NaphS2]|nr:PAS domain S-box protein [delta proteobacterium NaphS2]
MALARNVSASIERELSLLVKEISLLAKEISAKPGDREAETKTIERGLSRILENGVQKIEIVAPEKGLRYIYTPYRHWTETEKPGSGAEPVPDMEGSDNRSVWISRPLIRPSGIDLILAASLPGKTPRQLLFYININWFLAPLIKDIRSGQTGYAWLVDENGVFLFHPDAGFLGKSAFEARGNKDPSISFDKINFIQKNMLKGQEGTGWYLSGWHRGITGQIKKLIAYSPVMISESPSRKWSVAVVAPISEIEGVIQKGYVRQFLFQGLVILVILAGVLAIVLFEMRWSRILEKKVHQRTEALKKSEERYRSLVESAEDFIFSVDPAGKFLSVNSFTANFFGSRPEAFLGKELASQFPEDVAEKQLALIKRVYKHKKSMRDEFELKTGDHQIWISANFMPLKNEDGEVSAVLCIARDITENKVLERQLINTEKLASLGTLAAGVAHEVNNPLGVMLGFCDLLLRKTEKGTQTFEDLKTIERQGLHCKQVVENLLSFARVEEGDSEFADLNYCVNDIINVVKHTLEMSHVELVQSLADDVPMVKGNPRQLQQVFLNLINNAVVAMKGGGVLTIRTGQERIHRKAVVQFEDNGVGIKEEDMDHIFEPFFTTKPEGEGTGLGLFVSYGIIAKYGGSLDCVSHAEGIPGKPSGTIFTIKLPTRKRNE